jgi:hypothetical protein
MTHICIEEFLSWAAQLDIEMTSSSKLEYKPAGAHGSSLLVTTETRQPSDLILLANRLVLSNHPADDDDSIEPYTGCKLWLKESGVWNEVQEATATEAYEALLRGYGQQLKREPVLIFGREERSAAVVFILHMILFGWDAYLVPASGVFLCHISHDGYIQVIPRHPETQSAIANRFGPWTSEEGH